MVSFRVLKINISKFAVEIQFVKTFVISSILNIIQNEFLVYAAALPEAGKPRQSLRLGIIPISSKNMP